MQTFLYKRFPNVTISEKHDVKVCILVLDLDNPIVFPPSTQQVMVPVVNIFQDMEGFFSKELNVNTNSGKLNFLDTRECEN